MDCIKEKQIKKGATKSAELFEIIHTNICAPFDNLYFGGEKYLITLYTIFHIMDISVYDMKNLKQWMSLRYTLLKLKDNYIKR